MKLSHRCLGVIFFQGFFVTSMELPPPPSWKSLPETTIMQIVAISENWCALVSVDIQLSRLASKANINNLLQFSCALSRRDHINCMVKYAVAKNEKMMYFAIKNAPWCKHDDAVEIISYFTSKEEISILDFLSSYKKDWNNGCLKKLMPTIMAVYRRDPDAYGKYKKNFMADPVRSSVLPVISQFNHVSVLELLAEQEEYFIKNLCSKENIYLDSMALLLAADAGYLDIIKILIERFKFDVNICGNNKATPLFLALYGRHRDCVRYLLSKKADTSIIMEKYRLFSLLSLMVERGDVEMVEELLTEKTSLNHHINSATTAPLLISVSAFNRKLYGNYCTITEMLLNAGADPNIKIETSGDTALIIAIGAHKAPIIELILKKGALVNACNKEGKTALAIAAQKNRYDIMQLLLHYNADPNIADNSGMMPINYAINNKNDEAIILLRKNGALSDLLFNDENIPLKPKKSKRCIIS